MRRDTDLLRCVSGLVMLLATGFSIASSVYSCFLPDEPPAHSPAEFDLAAERCQTVCQGESKTKHIKSVPHILKMMLSDVRVVSH